MAIRLSENFRALFYAPFYAAHATGAFTEAGVDVVLVPSPSPPAAVKALLAGEVDVMWGGPLRVMMLRDSDPGSDLVCFCDVVARDPFFIIGAKPRPDFRFTDLKGLRFATVSEVPTPWICLADDIRRAGVDPVALAPIADRTHGGERGRLACRHARCRPSVPALRRAAACLRRGPSLVRRRHARPHRLHHPRHPPRRARAAARRAAEDDPRRPSHAGLVRTHASAEIAERLRDYFPDVAPAIFAGAIERYRALGLWGSDPVIRREGYDRLHAAMRAAGTLRRDIAFEDCVDTKLAEQAIA